MRVRSPRCTSRRPPLQETTPLIAATILVGAARKNVLAVSAHDLRRDREFVVCEDFFGNPLWQEEVPQSRPPPMRERPVSGLAIRRKPGIANQGSPRYRGLQPCSGVYTPVSGKESLSLQNILKFMVLAYSRIDRSPPARFLPVTNGKILSAEQVKCELAAGNRYLLELPDGRV